MTTLALCILASLIGVLIGWLFGFACGLFSKREIGIQKGSNT